MSINMHAALVSLAGLLAFSAPSPVQASGNGPEMRAVERAIRLLPERPMVPIRVIDPDLAADPEAVRKVDAFLVREEDGSLRQTIFLNGDSAVLRNAVQGRQIDIAILAIVIRHEQEHLRGAKEQDARRAEQDFLRRLIRDGRVPAEEGVAYLNILQTQYGLRVGE
jgi:hypothetical protein